MKNLTNKEMFGMVLAIVNGAEVEEKSTLVEFLEKQIAQIDKKAENKKPTKAQEENEKIKEELLQALELAEDSEGLTISDIQSLGFDYSNQKLSALLNQLYKDGKVDKAVGKDRKTTFKLA